ncbi:hypothetical protein [Paenibacillus sp. FSL M7-1046]|uniref:hypothetical protein n=1 Tax=Paenibacillus sp. FSL M7-1046 TaxID=2975315 RepID=UPI0030FB8389
MEYAILDKAGRLQVPAAYLESIGAKDANKVKLELADERIVLTPSDVPLPKMAEKSVRRRDDIEQINTLPSL